MKRNTASQIIGAQMVSATDGSAFTGSVTVYVTGDGGTQAAGSVGSGACTHEGNGYHTYAPAQAETDFAHVAFTFVGSGAIPATVQVYPSFPQTGDAFARLGAPAGASISADVAAIVADTNELQTDWADGGRLDLILDARASQASVNTIDGIVDDILLDTAEIGAAGAGLTALASAANLAIVAGYLDTEIAAIKAKTDNLPAAPAATGDIPTAAAVADAVWDEALAGHAAGGSAGAALAAAGSAGDPWATELPGAYDPGTAGQLIGDYLDAAVSTRATQTSVDDLPTNAELATALDALPTATENADALLNRDMSAVSDTNARSPLNALRFIRNKWDIAAGTLTVKKEDDSTTAWTAAVTATEGANPVTGNDPA